MKYIPLLALVTLVTIGVGHADLIVTKHSSDFAYLYEMDVNPSGQDLDTNSSIDYFAGTAGGSTIPQTYTGGVAASDQSPTSGAPQNLFRTDIGGSITRATLADANTPWTFELSARKTGGTQGADGWFGVAMQNPGASASTRVNFEDDRISYRTGGSYVDYLVGTDFADGAFHTMRIAYEGSDNYFVWINDILLNSDLTSANAFAGGNGSFNTGGAWFLGDFSGGIGGEWEVDYIRYEAGAAFAAVPEASEASLFVLGAMALAFYRRK